MSVTIKKKRIIDGSLMSAMHDLQNLPTSVENCDSVIELIEKLEDVLTDANQELKKLYSEKGVSIVMSNGVLAPQYKSVAEQELMNGLVKELEGQTIKVDVDAPLVLKYPRVLFKPSMVRAFKGLIVFTD